jgi:hypothetical protein
VGKNGVRLAATGNLPARFLRTEIAKAAKLRRVCRVNSDSQKKGEKSEKGRALIVQKKKRRPLMR